MLFMENSTVNNVLRNFSKKTHYFENQYFPYLIRHRMKRRFEHEAAQMSIDLRDRDETKCSELF